MHSLLRSTRVLRSLALTPRRIRTPTAAPRAAVSRSLAAAGMEEHFDIVDAVTGQLTGEVRPRSQVHAQGLYHRAVHVWLWAPSRGELLLQRRAAIKDSWPDRLDISCAGHISAGEAPLPTAGRELQEELGLELPPSRFEPLFVHLETLASVQKGRPFVNNEFNHVFLVTLTEAERAGLEPGGGGFRLQAEEVSGVIWVPWSEVRRLYTSSDPSIVPLSDWASYARLFDTLQARVDAAASTAAAGAAAAQATPAAAAAAAAGDGR